MNSTFSKNQIFSMITAALIVLGAVSIVFPATMAQEDGEFVDEIEVEVRLDRDLGVGDAAEGELDVFLEDVPGSLIEGLDEDMRAQIDMIESTGSYNELYFNPAATEKYTVEIEDGEYEFNPFSMQEIRYAMNWVVDREGLVEDVYDGWAEPRYTSAGLRHPAWEEHFLEVKENHGLTAGADFDKAYEMISDAMDEAAEDDELVGEVTTIEDEDSPIGYWWAYQGPNDDEPEPIVIDIVNRAAWGEHGTEFAANLEEVGFQAEPEIYESSVATSLAYYSDPVEAFEDWNVYTARWSAAAAQRYDDTGAYQMYTDLLSFTPGMMHPDPEFRYTTPELSELARPLESGAIEDEDEYWDIYSDLLYGGIEDSIRIFEITTVNFYPYNNQQVQRYVPDRLIGWSHYFTPRTIQTSDGTLKMAQYTEAGDLFMDQWNRIAGEDDTYSVRMMRTARDKAAIHDPTTGEYIPMRADWNDFEREVEFEEGEPTPQLEVPETALDYDVEEREWYEVGENVDAVTSITFDYKFSNWHSGHEMDDSDLAAWYAFAKEYATEEGERHNSVFAGQWSTMFNQIKGIEWHGDGEVTVYGDYTFPIESEAAGFYSGAINPVNPWQVDEAFSTLVQEGDSPVHEEDYSWTEGEVNWVHYISEYQGQDAEAVLEEMAEEGEIPPYLDEANNAPFPIEEEELEDDVEQINDFFEEYEHYYISQGPFVITGYDPDAQRMNFERFTELVDDHNYPFEADYWSERFELSELSFGFPTVQTEAFPGEAIPFSITVEDVQRFPEETRQPAQEGEFTVELRKDGEVLYSIEPEMVEPGVLEGTIPADITADLETGFVELLISGQKEDQPLTSDQVFASIYISDPDDVEYSNPEVDKTELEAGEEFTATVEVTNNDNVDHEPFLTYNGERAFADDVVEPGETKTIEVTHSIDEGGEYELSWYIDEPFATITVEEPEEEVDTTLIIVLVVIVIIVAAGAYYYSKK